MAEIRNLEAYFGTIVRNSYKNEYRSNDNYFNHISSVGDDSDIQQKSGDDSDKADLNISSIEMQLYEASVKNWLLFMDNEQLHRALSSLPTADVEFLLELSKFHFQKAAFARVNNVSQQAVSKRFHRLRKIILKILKTGL